MTSNDSTWLNFFAAMGWFGAGLVIIGVVLESAELIVKLGRKSAYRKWVGDVFGKDRRKMVVASIKYIHPRILPFEAVGFALLFIGLAIELVGSSTAEIVQSKENAELQATNVLISLRVEQLRASNDALEAKQNPRTIDFSKKFRFIDLVKDLKKFPLKIVIGQADNETANFAAGVQDLFQSAGFITNTIIHVPDAIIQPSAQFLGYGHVVHAMIALYCSTNGEFHGTRGFMLGTNTMTIEFMKDLKDPDWPLFDVVNKLNESAIDTDIMDGRTILLNGNPVFQPGEFGIYIPQKSY
jgi:hypothetical protein